MKALKLLILFLFLFFSKGAIIISQIPPSYYDGAIGLSGQELRQALHLLIKDHITFPYTSTGTDVWKILQEADRDPENPENVLCIYSGFSMNGPAQYNDGDGWNREHIWPQSRGSFGTARGAGTDLHHLRAADISTNSARSNRFFDIAPKQYIDQSGQYSGPTNSYTSSHRYVFEPRDEVKGDIARMILYMVVRYEGTNNELNLELTDEILPSSDFSPLMGKASRLFEWHLTDPVDDEEQRRNDIIFSYQQNRNPFIDHPEFVCLIWPHYCNQEPQTGELLFSEYIEGTSWNKALEIANVTHQSINLDYYILKRQNNGSGDWSADYPLEGILHPGEVFTLAHISADPSLTSIANIVTGSSILTFNGDDPIALFNNRKLVDIIGVFDAGPISFGTDLTLVRKSSVNAPNTTFSLNEWNLYPLNTFQFFGAHNTTSSDITEQKSTITVLNYDNTIHITHPESILNYSLFNIQGQLLIRTKNHTNEILLKSLPPGIYIIQIETVSGFFTHKLLSK